jgi:hypothetical protein
MRCLRCLIGFPPLKPRLAVDLDRVAVRQDVRLLTRGERPSTVSVDALGFAGVSYASQLFGPCAARAFGYQAPFSRVACATWRSNRLLRPRFPIPHYRSEVSACVLTLPLRHRGKAGTSALRGRVPVFQASQRLGLYVRFQRGKCNNRSKPVRFSMSPCEKFFDSRSSFKRSPITIMSPSISI